MKVLLVNKFHYQKGGSETFYFTVSEALKKEGHEVIYFSVKNAKNIECEQDKYFVSEVSTNEGFFSKIRLMKNMFYSKEAYRNISRLIEEEKPDLAILNLVHKHITCSVIDALKEHNIKTIWVAHDLIFACPSYTMLDGNGNVCSDCLQGDFSHCVKKKCIKHSKLLSYLSVKEANYIKKHNWYNKVDAFVCPSLFYVNTFKKSNFTNSKIEYIPNPIFIDEDSGSSIDTTKKEYILYLGRLSYEKGLATLLKSAELCENIKFKIAGTGPIEEELKQMSENMKNVEFLGFVNRSNIGSVIDGAKAVVIPSEWYENCPYSALETMSRKTPIIVSKIGGLTEMVEEGKNGFLFTPNNHLELTDKIKKIYELNQREYDSMCDYAYSIVKNKHNPDDYIKKIIGTVIN